MPTEDLYGDGPDQAAGMNSSKMTQKERDEETRGKTAQLNSEICPGMEVGDEIVLRITGVNEGEYTVEYEPSEKGKHKEEEEESAPTTEGNPGGGSMYD